MRLSQLVASIDLIEPSTSPDAEITGMALDSRAVLPGYLFAALPGGHASGTRHVAEAVQRGAAAVLTGEHEPLNVAVPCLRAAHPRLALSRMAARFFAPAPRRIVAVTGTAGKSSVVQYVRQLWQSLGHAAASIGTLGVIAPGKTDRIQLTTPDSITLHAALQRLAQEDMQRVAMEASSHGLDMCRLHHVPLAAAAFTNLSRDHLDYHRTMDHYLAAKLRLFREILPEGAAAVLNADIPEYPVLRDVCRERGLRLIRFGRQGEEIALLECAAGGAGLHLTMRILGAVGTFTVPIVGGFQAQNIMAAAGLVLAEDGVTADELFGALPSLTAVPGRLQPAGEKRSEGGVGRVFVDYAHKPGALHSVLCALRPLVPRGGRLAVLFGCGGDRDAGKRPLMGEVAARLADRVIVTDDNPRGEDAAAIRGDIVQGTNGAPHVREVGGRSEAIARAIAELEPNDILVIAGKGHETGQIVGEETLPFDDVEVARRALSQAMRGEHDP